MQGKQELCSTFASITGNLLPFANSKGLENAEVNQNGRFDSKDQLMHYSVELVADMGGRDHHHHQIGSKASIAAYPRLRSFSPGVVKDQGLTAEERRNLKCIATVSGAAVGHAFHLHFPNVSEFSINRGKLSGALDVVRQSRPFGDPPNSSSSKKVTMLLDVFAREEGQHYIPINDANGVLKRYITVNVLETASGTPTVDVASSMFESIPPNDSRCGETASISHTVGQFLHEGFDDMKIMMGDAAAAAGLNEQRRRQSSVGSGGGGSQSRFLVTPDRTMIVSVGPDGSWDITSSAERLRGLKKTESTSNTKPIFAATLSAAGKRELVFMKNNQMESVCIAQPLFKTRVDSPIRTHSPSRTHSPRKSYSPRSHSPRFMGRKNSLSPTFAKTGESHGFKDLSDVKDMKRLGMITTPVGKEFSMKYRDIGDLKVILDPRMSWLQVTKHFIPPRVVEGLDVTQTDGVAIKDDLREYDENIRWKVYVKLLEERDARFALRCGDRKICYFDVTAKPPLKEDPRAKLPESTHYRLPIPNQSMVVSGLVKTLVEKKQNGKVIKEKEWLPTDVVLDNEGNMTDALTGLPLIESEVKILTP